MRFLLSASALALVLTTACGNAPPVASQDVGDAGGVPLGFGFSTVPGTALQGAVFPQPLEGTDGFVAVLTLTGDAAEVFDSFLGQAAALGYRLPVQDSSRNACTFTRNGELLFTDDGNSVGWSATPEEADALFCGSTPALQDGEDFENSASLQLSLAQGKAWGETYSTVVLDLRRDGVVPEGTPQPGPADGVRDLAVEVSWSLPERFGADVGPLQVVEGSELAGPVGARNTCAGGYYAVVEVTADLTTVLDGYTAQIVDSRFQGLAREDKPEPVAQRYYTAAGGGTWDLVAVTVEGGTWLLVDRCND